MTNAKAPRCRDHIQVLYGLRQVRIKGAQLQQRSHCTSRNRQRPSHVEYDGYNNAMPTTAPANSASRTPKPNALNITQLLPQRSSRWCRETHPAPKPSRSRVSIPILTPCAGCRGRAHHQTQAHNKWIYCDFATDTHGGARKNADGPHRPVQAHTYIWLALECRQFLHAPQHSTHITTPRHTYNKLCFFLKRRELTSADRVLQAPGQPPLSQAESRHCARSRRQAIPVTHA